MKTFDKEIIWNVEVHAVTVPEAITSIDEMIDAGGRGNTVFCANPNSLVEAGKDPVFLRGLRSATILLPDGAGIVAASMFLHGSIRRRASGPDLLEALVQTWNSRRDRSIIFVGSTVDTQEKIRKRMQDNFSQVALKGTYSPAFHTEVSEEDTVQIVKTIESEHPSILVVGMTAPKQEKWIVENIYRLNVPVILAVGAALDFFAGTKKRSPQWARTAGLEWLPRLLKEPARLWRRNIISTPAFLFHIIKQKLAGKENYANLFRTMVHP